MKELLKKILALPPITLSDQEWNIVLRIVKDNEDLSPRNIQRAVDNWRKENANNLFDYYRLENFKRYIAIWLDVKNSVVKKTQEIVAIWKNLFFCELPADDLMPVTMSLIDAHKDILEQLHTRLETACMLDRINYAGYALANLNVAISAKLDLISKDEKIETVIDNKLIERVQELQKHLPDGPNELKRQSQLLQLATHCQEYKDYLAGLIKQKLAEEFKDIYDRHYSDKSQVTNEQKYAEDYIILDIIDENNKSTTSKKIIDKELLSLLQKFMNIFDLYVTCTRKHIKSKNKLEEFGEKYRLCRNTLEQDSLEQLYSWLTKSIRVRSTAERFSETAGVFSQKCDVTDNEMIKHPRL